jgi:hypothetical protein
VDVTRVIGQARGWVLTERAKLDCTIFGKICDSVVVTPINPIISIMGVEV